MRRAVRYGAGLGALLFLATVSGAASAGAAERGVAPQDEILVGVRSCVASVGPAGLDEAHLVADGWSKGTMASNGTPVATGLIFYGKGELTMISSRAARGQAQLCTVVARVASAQSVPGIKAALAAAYGKPIKDDGRGEQVFRAPDHRLIDVASTGSADRPSVRIAIGYVSQETK